MATQDWFYPIAHASDADFRGWGANLSAKLAAVGLVQTSDTGQINWSTVTRPAINVYAGYEIWRYPDSSIFMKWEFGTSNVSTGPQVRVSVATGVNGAGTLTGNISDARTIMRNNASPVSAGTDRRSVMCLSSGFFGFSGYLDAAATDTEQAFFAVARTTDANGNVTGDGAAIYWRNSSSASGHALYQTMDFSTFAPRTAQTDGSYGFVPSTLIASTYIAGFLSYNYQAFINWGAYPVVRPTMAVCTIVRSEMGQPPFTPFETTLIGSTQRTYISLGHATNGATNGGTLYSLAMLFE
jgi:hypothetical protein